MRAYGWARRDEGAAVTVTRIRSLELSEWWFLLSSAALLPIYWVAVRSGLYRPGLWPLHAVEEPGRQLPPETVRKMGALVNAAARYSPVPSTCLIRSLVLVSQLRRRNVPSSLRIGVCLQDGQLQAHAWVEHQGMPVNDSLDVDSSFAPIGPLDGYDAWARS